MIQPTRPALLLVLGGFPLAALPVLVDERLWGVWLGYVAVLTAALGADALLAPAPGRLELEPSTPERLYIGEADPLLVQLGVPGLHRDLRVRVLPELHEELEPVPEEPVLVPGGGTAGCRFPLRPQRRGTVEVRALWLRWSGPLGLTRRTHRRALEASIPVVPNIRAVRATALRFFRSRDFQAGLKVEHYVGDGSEFDRLRDFLPGFDPRAIDWKASARHMRLLCREYRAERDHAIVLAIDTGHLMAEPVEGIPRLDHAINAALLVGYVGLKTGDRVGLYSFDARPGRFVRPQSGLEVLHTLQRESAALEYEPTETNFTLAMTRLSAYLARRSLVIVFTDFTDSIGAELMVDNVGRLARRHLVLFVSLRDTSLDRLAERGPASLHDLNRAVVAEDLIHDRELVVRRLRQSGILCLDSGAEDLSVQLINRYLDVKRREML